MTQEKVHEAICSMSEVDKRALAIQCQASGVNPVMLEKTLASILTSIEELNSNAKSIYDYWRRESNE